MPSSNPSTHLPLSAFHIIDKAGIYNKEPKSGRHSPPTRVSWAPRRIALGSKFDIAVCIEVVVEVSGKKRSPTRGMAGIYVTIVSICRCLVMHRTDAIALIAFRSYIYPYSRFMYLFYIHLHIYLPYFFLFFQRRGIAAM